MLDLLDEESVSVEKAVIELVYKFDENSYREYLKSESIAKVRFKLLFFVHKHIYIYIYTYGH